jgi:hypothetical protein
MQRIDDLEGKAELPVREPPKREGNLATNQVLRADLFATYIGTYRDL